MDKRGTVHIVLINEHNEVLGVSRKDNHNDFGLPGGKVDYCDRNLINAIIRETREETGLEIYNIELIYSAHRDGHMGHTYIADHKGEISTDEPHVVKWVPFTKLLEGKFGEWNGEVLKSLESMKISVKV
jgi:ADP-ribose pyrophosphatase YjhB (NUDIX family)